MPYAPGTEYRGDQYLFNGIAGAGQKIGNAVEQLINKYKQTQDQGKAADYFFKSLGDQAPQVTGIHPEQWKTLGSADKAQAMVGLLQAQGAKQAQQQQQLTGQQIAMMQEQMKQRQLDAQRQQGFAQSVQQMMGAQGQGGNPMAPGQEGAPGPTAGTGTAGIDPQKLIALYLQSGMPMGGIDDVGRALRAIGDVQSPDIKFSEDPVSGNRFATQKNTVMASGVNPAKANANLEPLHDQDGKVIGQAFRDPRSGNLKQFNVKGDQGHIEIPDPDNPVFGPRMRIPLSQAKEQFPELFKKFTGGAAGAAAGGKKLDAAGAKKFLEQANGDKAKARELAKQAGFTF